MNGKMLLACALVVQLISPVPALAEEVPTGTQTASAPASDLDLNSQQRTMSAGQAGLFESATITVGDTTRSITHLDLVTPAELVALSQVLSGSVQSLQLGQLGNAIGGTFRLDRQVIQAIGNLVIPQGVTAIHDFAAGSPVNLAGSLTNAGSVLAVSSNAAVSTASFSAANIFNSSGALISSLLPASGLTGITSAVANLNLNLIAVHDIINAGTIASAGNLNLTAGGSIVNALPAGVSGPGPLIQAMNNITLITSQLVNSGSIAANLGNINIASVMAQSLTINNVGGQLQALAGALNVRDALFGAKADTTIWGGDLLSRELNLYSGTGHVLVDANVISGVVNVWAHEAHITTSNGTMYLGTLALTGDPVFANLGGSIEIQSGLGAFSGQDLAFLAADDVFSTDTLTISTSGSGGTLHGGDILIVAGASFGGTGGSTGSDTSSPPNTTAGETYIISPGAGGNISLPNISLDSSAHTGGSNVNNGGSVTLIAYSDITGSKGSIRVADVTTGGGNNGMSGAVLVVGGTTSSSLSFTSIDTVGEGASGGAVAISNTNPDPSPVTLTIDPGGNTFSLSGAFAAGALPAGATTSTVSLGAINSRGSVQVASGNTLNINANVTAPGAIDFHALGNIVNVGGSGGGKLSAATVTLVSDFATIGSSGSGAIRTDVGSGALTVTAPSGSAFLAETGGATLNLSAVNSTSGSFSLVTDGTGDIVIDGGVNAGTVTGALDITVDDGSLRRVTGTLAARTMTLTATGGNIGAGAGQPIVADAQSLTLVTDGDATIEQANDLTIGNTSSVGDGKSLSITVTSGSLSLPLDFAVDGGDILLSAGTNLSVQQLSTASASGSAGNMNLTAGTAGTGSLTGSGDLSADGGSGDGGMIEITASGALQVSGNVSANGGGTAGDGGQIVISMSDALVPGPLRIGASGGFQFISGDLHADGSGTGNPGSVSISNPNVSGSLSIDLQGTISAASSSQGTLTFNGVAGQSVDVSGPGTLVGVITASGDSVNIATGGGNLILEAVTATAGNVGIAAGSGNVDLFDDVTATGLIQITSGAAHTVTVDDGVTLEAAGVTVNTPNLNNNGVITASAFNLAMQSNAPSRSLVVAFGPNSQLNASGVGGIISFNGTFNGPVTVSGGPDDGDLFADGGIQFNTGIGVLGPLDVYVHSIGGSGIVMASGSSVSLRTTNGNLTFSLVSTDPTGSIALASDTGSIDVLQGLAVDGNAIDVSAGTSLNLLGVSTSSSTGTAGNITLKAGTDADGDLVALGAITADGAVDGSGGTIVIEAGDGPQNNSGHVQVAGSITANGDGLADGGLIRIKYSDATAPAVFRIGPDGLEPPVENFIAGAIHVDALGSGHGGDVFITNTAAQQLSIDLTSTISANSANAANVGLLNFLNVNQPVSISGPGTLVGGLIVSGSQLVSNICCLTFLVEDINIGGQGISIINPNGHVVVLGHLTSNGGAVIIETLSVTNTAGGLIRTTGPASSAGITINSATFLNEGMVDSNGLFAVNADSDLSITGNGSLAAASGFNFSSTLGNVTVSQAAIEGAIGGSAGLSFSVTTTSSTSGIELSAGNLTALGGSISFNSATSLGVVDGSQVEAFRNITLLAPGSITIGQLSGASGVVIKAGSLAFGNAGDELAVLSENSVETAGFILIDSYLNGAGTGDVTLGDGVRMTSHGGTLTFVPGDLPTINPGFIALRSGNDLTLGAGVRLTANGDNLLLSAVDDIEIGAGATLISRAKYDDLSRARLIPSAAFFLITSYTGGGIAIFAGDQTTDLQVLLDEKIGQRTGFNLPNIQSGVPLLEVNDVIVDRGGLFEVTMPADTTDKFTLVGNVFQSIGGVILLDPPATSTLSISSAAAIRVIGPLVLPPAPPGQPRQAAAAFVSLNAGLVSPTHASLIATDTTRTNQSTAVVLDQQRRKAEELAEGQEREAATSGNQNVVVRTWFMSNGYCQPFAFEGEDGSTVVTAQGTFISASGKGTLALKEGTILAMAGAEPLTIETVHGTIVVPGNSSSLVNHRPTGALRISSLSGASASVTLAGSSQPVAIAMPPGEEVVVADAELAEEEFIPSDGVERELIAGAVTIGDLRMQRNRFNRGAMAERGDLMSCQLGAFSVLMRRRMDGVRTEMSGSPIKLSSKDKQNLPASEGKMGGLPVKASHAGTYGLDITPVSYVPSGAGLPPADCRTISTRGATFKHLPGTALTLDNSGVVHLDRGETLIDTYDNTVLESGIFKVHFQPGTTSLVTTDGDVLKVRNLWESKGSSVRVYVGNRLIASSAGEELILTRSDALRMAALRKDPVGRRRTKSFDLADGQTITSSEVSFVSLAADSPLLNRLLKSARADERAIAGRMIKMAACLAHAQSGHGSFSTSAQTLKPEN